MPNMKKLRSWVKGRMAELTEPVINKSIGTPSPTPQLNSGNSQIVPPKVAKAVPSQWVKEQDAKRRRPKPAAPPRRSDVVAAARMY